MCLLNVTSSSAAACAATGAGDATTANTAAPSNTCHANARRRSRIVVIYSLLDANAVYSPLGVRAILSTRPENGNPESRSKGIAARMQRGLSPRTA